MGLEGRPIGSSENPGFSSGGTNNADHLILTSSKQFQSAVVPGGRNSNPHHRQYLPVGRNTKRPSMRNVLIISFLAWSITASSQVTKEINFIDSICSSIDTLKTNFLGLTIRASSSSGKEWQRYRMDTITRRHMRVITHLDKSSKSYRFYILDNKLIRLEERAKLKQGKINLLCYYFVNNNLVFGTLTRKRKQFFLKRVKDFLEQREFTLSYR